MTMLGLYIYSMVYMYTLKFNVCHINSMQLYIIHNIFFLHNFSFNSYTEMH